MAIYDIMIYDINDMPQAISSELRLYADDMCFSLWVKIPKQLKAR